jgi:hypothetical protein
MPTKLSQASYEAARTFLATRSRGLERCLYRFHFEPTEGARSDVIRELGRFQNPDGGFGRALEPDVRMAGSSVVATKFALQVLVDIGAPAGARPVKDAIAYLQRTYDDRIGSWPLVPEAVMSAPHAPWWDHGGLERDFGGFQANPKAGILRCLLEYGELVPRDFVDALTCSLLAHFDGLPVDMLLFDAISCLQLLQSDHLEDDVRQRLLAKLEVTAREIAERDPKNWPAFCVKPLWLAPAPQAPLAAVLADDVQRNLDYEIESMAPDGSWSPTWSWGTYYPEEWARAKQEWKGILTLATLRSLRDYGRIVGVPPDGGETGYKYHID